MSEMISNALCIVLIIYVNMTVITFYLWGKDDPFVFYNLAALPWVTIILIGLGMHVNSPEIHLYVHPLAARIFSVIALIIDLIIVSICTIETARKKTFIILSVVIISLGVWLTYINGGWGYVLQIGFLAGVYNIIFGMFYFIPVFFYIRKLRRELRAISEFPTIL